MLHHVTKMLVIIIIAFFQQEVEGIDFTPELPRRASRTRSLGRVSPYPTTRMRSRKGSKSSTSDALSNNDVIVSNDVISTSGVMNDVISNGDVISTNDVISGQLPESDGSQTAVL